MKVEYPSLIRSVSAPLCVVICLAVAAAIISQVPQKAAASPAPHPGAAAAAWRPLFNGHNLDGWEVVGPGSWSAEDGALVMRRPAEDHGGGWLVTRQNYGDFILRFQLQPGAHLYNSGVLIRDAGHAKVGRPAVNGFEIKLAQGDRVENGNGTIWYVADAPIHEIPEHEWTSFEIRCEGDHITTLMDGHKMAETHSRRSYYGGIGFHLHGGNDKPEVRFRKIEIQELAPGPHPDRLMEEQLTEAPGEFTDVLPDTALANGWTLKDGVLHGSGAGQESTAAVKGTYGDFMLTFDFRVSAGGTAGVEFRGGSEFRISDKDETFPSGSVPGVSRAFFTDQCLQNVYHPGRWNQAHLYVSGNHMVTLLNLVKSGDGHSTGSLRGPLAFRVSAGSTVDFRNVRIKKIG